ncbi:MAG: helix-turn-helix transcriptional regulator [Lachnospiraceae bacterium]|nr:helix-turn-helix transcriptional regulator [Candidatus Colinaster scatohippi]
MTRQEKLNYIVNENPDEFILKEEQERLKYVIMQEFVKLRKEKKVTQAELAKRTGIARPNIARMENGSYNPTIDMMARLAAGLDMHLDIKWVPNNN